MSQTPHKDVSHIAVDWGTSSFRLWTLDRAGQVLAERRSAQGLAASAAEGFETVLDTHLAALGVAGDVPAVLCGMVGSRSGWVEAAYLDAPVALDGLVAAAIPVPAARRPVRILAGIAQRLAGRPDVMRGEETQLIGLSRSVRSGLACLPGTHSKWVTLEDGAVTGFSTFMTGELFQLVRAQSVVTGAVDGAAPVDPASPAFAAGVAVALAAPATLTNQLFALRAGWLLACISADDTLARLSGLLIGLEIAGVTDSHPPGGTVHLVASGAAAALYGRALAQAGFAVELHDADACVREGLHAAALHLFAGCAEGSAKGFASR